VRLGHCPNQLCTSRCNRGGGEGKWNKKSTQEKESGKTWTLLDPARREEDKGRDSLDGEVAASHVMGMHGLGGCLGVHGLGSRLGARGEAAWEHVMRRTGSARWPRSGR
jgi:hypothetical protein